MDIGTIVFLVIVIGIVGYAVAIYNRLVALRNRFKNAFSQIDVQLKRRHDLIPNLVETAKGYMKHERETLEAVIQARNRAASAARRAEVDAGDRAAMRELMGAEQALGGALGQFFALSENYPDLKADQTMTQLMEELSSTENRIAFARQAYNDSVMTYNTGIESFPNNFLAGPFNFRPAELWEISAPEEREPVDVSFT